MDEMTELYDAEIPRVDLVDKAANGTRFLIAKNGGGLVDADTVRELIGKTAEPAPAPAADHVTLSGSPAAIMRMMHEAAVAKSSAPTDDVSKELDVSDPDTLDASELMAEPDQPGEGSTMQPGSPAWEAIDAATACKWTAILARAKAAIELLADREMLEAATGGDPDDADNAYDLNDACTAIEYAIGVLAPFAVAEHTEVETAADIEALGKALAGYDPAGLDVIEGLGHVRKAGRVLSTANEAAIRGAVEQLQKVLASLPQAPTTDDSGQPVAKEETMDKPTVTKDTDAPAEAENVTKDAEQAPAAEETPAVAKADGEGRPAQVAVYDAKGKLVGIADPADITPIAGADQADDGEEVVPDTPDDATPDGAQTETPDLAPAPAGTVGTPADDVAKSGDEATTETTDEIPNDTPAVLKSDAETVAKAEIESRIAKQEETIATQAAALTQATELIETLKGRVEALEKQPAESKVFTNGVRPSPALRGQDNGVPPIDVAKGQAMKQELYKSTDATEQNRIFADMQAMAVARLQQIHGRPSA